MTDEGKPLTANHTFKKIIWRHAISIGQAMEQTTTWSITGIAAIAGLFISNLDSVGKLVSPFGLRWFLILFTASLVFGAISKQIGMALTKGLEMVENLETILSSEQGQTLMGQMSISPKALIKEIAEPFFWPLSAYMRKSGVEGLQDYLSTDKRFVKMFCIQLIFVYLHGIMAAVGLLTMACSIIS